MAGPTIEMIAERMKTFSKGMKLPPRSPEDIRGKTIEFNSQIPLHCNWEQILNLKTGELYYVNMRTGEKSSTDPHKAYPLFGSCCNVPSFDNNGGRVSGGQPPNRSRLAPKPGEEPLNFLVPARCKACSMNVNRQQENSTVPKESAHGQYFTHSYLNRSF